MALRALRFVVGANGVGPARSELTDELIRSFAATRLQSSPAAYVVLNSELPGLLKFRNIVIDRGRKHEAKPLAKLLLGHTKIPFINGSYESSGQLVRSVRTLLENAFAKDDHNIYIIGTTETLLDELWEKAGSAQPGDLAASKLRAGKPAPKSKFDGALSSQLLLQLLTRREIPEDFLHTFVGSSTEVQLVRQLVMRAASSDDPVLVLGDTGTGKEVIARSIHNYSARASEKFVPVNCGAIPSELLESELFGHKRYTFTDAKYDKKGLWEITGNGTLFLDEVGDLALIHQVKILRALEENRIRPIGEAKEIRVNARVIAATNRDLFSMVKTGQFREDLYYRLRAFLLRTPVLRDHPEDIPTLARFFWKKIARDERASLPDDIVAGLQSYSWPGNARELKAVLMSLHSLFGKDDLDIARLRAVFQIQGQGAAESPEAAAQNEMITHRVDCLRHFRRADEVLRACVVSVRPLVEGNQTDLASAASVRASLRARLGELEVLCLNPLLFHSKVTFDVVDGLKEKLSYFYGLLEGDGKIALSFWKNEVSREVRLALTTIFQESERLEANV
ncbi:MAG TPA: sigma 54-interacting transcriptional regulator [Blastocatellia bacterium]|nr:sigma 54-interacting transcriptional regulator [Blastocatellia bacterium]